MKPKRNTSSLADRKLKRIYTSLNVGNYVFKRTKQFKYLESVLTERNEMEKETLARILTERFEDTIIHYIITSGYHLCSRSVDITKYR